MIFLESFNYLLVDGDCVLAKENCWGIRWLVNNLFVPVVVSYVSNRVSLVWVGLKYLLDKVLTNTREL